MSLTVSTLMGVSATMCSMVGGFLLLRHTRITGQIEESRRREVLYRVEQEAIRQSSEALKEDWAPYSLVSSEYLRGADERLRILAGMKDVEGVLVSRLSASRGNLRRAVVSWTAMLAVGVAAPAAAVGLFGWQSSQPAVGAAQLFVVGAMVMSIASVLKQPKPESKSDRGIGTPS